MWVLDYLKEIETDFVAIYNILYYEDMDSRKWFRLAKNLPYYEGAFRRRLQMELEEEKGGDKYLDENGEKRSMTMKEALSKAKEDPSDLATLESINEDGKNSAFGALFEHTTVPAKQ